MPQCSVTAAQASGSTSMSSMIQHGRKRALAHLLAAQDTPAGVIEHHGPNLDALIPRAVVPDRRGESARK
jgi:Tfp pilus assembly ATPase PilU